MASILTVVDGGSWVPGGRGWVLDEGVSSLGAMTVLDDDDDDVGSSSSSSSLISFLTSVTLTSSLVGTFTT